MRRYLNLLSCPSNPYRASVTYALATVTVSFAYLCLGLLFLLLTLVSPFVGYFLWRDNLKSKTE